MRVCAVQSGTSADGIDVLVVDAQIDGAVLRVRPEHFETVPWEDRLQREILDTAHGAALDAASWCSLDTRLGEAFADAVRPFSGLDLVVSHGQTLYHWRDGGRVRGSLQLGEPSLIAEAAWCPVISHLRHADIAAGGEGAPLMAIFDRLWLEADARASHRPLATVNIGGIANVQIVRTDGTVHASDTGPGNALLDAHIDRVSGGRARFDEDGALAAAGTVQGPLLGILRAHPYFTRPAPKSTGRHEFHLGIVDEALAVTGPVGDADIAATLVELTAVTIADAVRAALPAELIVSGGGAHNPVLMSRLRFLLRPTAVTVSADRGLSVDAKENFLFAALGVLSWHGVPVSLTGPPSRIAGRLTPGPKPPAMPAPGTHFDRLEISS